MVKIHESAIQEQVKKIMEERNKWVQDKEINNRLALEKLRLEFNTEK